VIHEDEDILVFADTLPVNLGHSLVIPKDHHQNIYDLPNDLLAKMAITAKVVSEKIKQATGAEGINIEMNNDPAAGQLVFHAHIHVIPRFSNDGFTHWKGPLFTKEQITETAEKIRAELQQWKTA
jgi:histidine triad (HIT) family protein